MREISRTVTVYAAFDGEEFPTAAECRAYERDQALRRLIGLTAEEIDAALTRADLDLADAIERTGYLISNARKAAGELRRRPGRDDEPTAAEEEPST